MEMLDAKFNKGVMTDRHPNSRIREQWLKESGKSNKTTEIIHLEPGKPKNILTDNKKLIFKIEQENNYLPLNFSCDFNKKYEKRQIKWRVCYSDKIPSKNDCDAVFRGPVIQIDGVMDLPTREPIVSGVLTAGANTHRDLSSKIISTKIISRKDVSHTSSKDLKPDFAQTSKSRPQKSNPKSQSNIFFDAKLRVGIIEPINISGMNKSCGFLNKGGSGNSLAKHTEKHYQIIVVNLSTDIPKITVTYSFTNQIVKASETKMMEDPFSYAAAKRFREMDRSSLAKKNLKQITENIRNAKVYREIKMDHILDIRENLDTQIDQTIARSKARQKIVMDQRVVTIRKLELKN